MALRGVTGHHRDAASANLPYDGERTAPSKETILWCVSPVYHDVESFCVLQQRIREVFTGGRTPAISRLQFVVVDDTAGADLEIDRLAQLSDTVVVRAPFNLGHQRAIVYGLRSVLPKIADSDLIVTLDSDGEDSPEDVPRLLEPLTSTDASRRDVVLARRTKRSESLKFRVSYIVFRLIFRMLTGVVIRSGNFAAYRGWLARRILPHPAFDLCYSSTFFVLDVRIRSVPCARGRRIAGQSRMNTSRLLLHGLRMLMPFLDRIALRALFLFSSVFLVSVLLSAAVFAVRILTEHAIPGWATSTVLLALIASIVALGNFIVLFATFSQSRGISLNGLERDLSLNATQEDVGGSPGESS